MAAQDLALREVRASDLPVFFEHQADKDAGYTAAVASKDRPTFDAHWARIMADDTVELRTVVWDGEVAGSVLSFERNGMREVGYWIGREFWGKGIATAALAAFLREYEVRPLHALVASDNFGSVRVLEKCGFVRIDARRVSHETRPDEFEELVFELR